MVGFRHFCKVLGQVRSVQLTPHIRRLPNLCQDGLRCLLVLCWSVNLARFCRCFSHADRPRTARGHVPARQFDEFTVGVVVHVTGWSAWCATERCMMAHGSKWQAIFWLFTVSSGVALNASVRPGSPQLSSMNATCLTGALPRISVLLCHMAWAEFPLVGVVFCLAVATDAGSGMKFQLCTGLRSNVVA